MSTWQEQFTKKMEGLRAQAASHFNGFAEKVLAPTFEEVGSFVSKWKIEASRPHAADGGQTFRFALNEDSYALVLFRIDDIDSVTCEYECWLPGRGRVVGEKANSALRNFDPTWARICFQAGLDHFISELSKTVAERPAEPALT